MVVAIDYFTKWIEVEPLATITTERIQKFIWKNIICRYGLPGVLSSDNSTQFTNYKIQDFCQGLGIHQVFTSIKHPQTNGQDEAANMVILARLKKQLDNAKRIWPDELPMVLWSYHTTA